METYQIDILNPKAIKLLQDLAELKLISMKPTGQNNFLKVLSDIRQNASKDAPTLEDITKEVESVRADRYAKKKK
ncbi:hypothetical protein CHU92_14320 [Flavobacterium cyanobacteriorum]|uniref:Uncharacterized protein n=1 Tax=Flavobacterium cyanobacteriorum TaxID=2022802 RepID=A0A255YSR0_9FLAO|nr:hypothetical protein [Flavobacterium cyanobacteriorum]OYQ32257.1 hypothetical protein CHU92_14320 [Flavobacterium cyanobacteriorum]